MKIKVLKSGETQLNVDHGTLWTKPDESQDIYLLVYDSKIEKYKAYNLYKEGHWAVFAENPGEAIEGLIPFTGILEISNG